MVASGKRIALFLKAMGGGGAERAMAVLARELARRGHAVDFVLSRARGPLLAEIAPEVRVVDLGGKGARGALACVARLDGGAPRLLLPMLLRGRPKVTGALPGLVAYLRRERPHALLSTFEYNALVALWARRLSGVPTRVLVREANALSQEVSHATRSENRLLPDLIHHWYPRADAIVAVTEGVADDLARTARLPRERIATIYNGLDLPRIRDLAGEPLDHPWLAPDAPPLVLAVGRLKPQKDHATLLRAFARLRAARAARLVILGEGPERAALERLARSLGIADDVALPGFAENPFAWMARARVLALSSAWEGTANVLIEALACGCPVVGTDSPAGPAEILEKGRWGRLVPVGDDEGLAVALAATLDAPPDADRLRARAEDFDAGRSAEAYLALLVGGSPG
jgi:glycosyltransferase involved in cell wall biosynthesis